MLEENLKKVEANIQAACERCGRKREEVTLIAVSKTKPVSMLKEVYDCGIRDFGENKVQELTDKYDQLPSDIKWHMIGHLQRNKIKYIIGKTALIHSVDSLRLAEAIEAESAKKGCITDVLLEVNVAQEESKFGFSAEELLKEIDHFADFSHIRVKGLMTIAPYVENPEENRIYFAKLKQLSVDITAKKVNNVTMSIFSMGMTNDYEVAIEEGATIVRVGTGIFGERNYDRT
ncbi:YggS family pyridoxal phosphate-dependent enzyme [Faecalicatena sp. Marseille-Q4148]|nr:YggS family pyridoxal phosphate-dependent enzyme [Faecalicatena sp. Marseille-Q4148]